MTALEIIGAAIALLLGVLKFFFWWQGRKYDERTAMLKSAEKVADASMRIEQEARRTHERVENAGHDTLVADGNKLLSGNDDSK